MRVHNLLALVAACLLAGTASASTILISPSVNNGGLLSDPAGVGAGAAVGLNGETFPSFAFNGVGRALAENGGTFSIGDGTDLNEIEDNPGVGIDGFAVYRVRYQGGSDAFGFVENTAGAAGGAGPNLPFDGRAFANSSDYFLLSDDIAVAGGSAGDTFNLSIDNFSAPNSVTAFIYFDNGTGTNLGSILGGSITDIPAPTGGFSSVRVGFLVENGNGDDSGLDNVNLELIPVPEPNAVALSLLALSSLGAIGMRTRLG